MKKQERKPRMHYSNNYNTWHGFSTQLKWHHLAVQMINRFKVTEQKTFLISN